MRRRVNFRVGGMVKTWAVVAIAVLLVAHSAWGADYFKKAMDTWNSMSSGTKGEGKGLSNGEMIEGLKEALEVGAKKAVNLASKPGGFLNDPEIRIPLPGQLEKVASVMRRMGMGAKVDQFEESMNHAAEKASASALPIFMDAIKGITFDDAKKLLNGGDTAITEFFKEKTAPQLTKAFEPIVHESVQEVGVTKQYQELTGGPWVSGLVKGSSFDLDHYVTEKSLNGLFRLLSHQEKEIRQNPAARTTDLLKKVFGSK